MKGNMALMAAILLLLSTSAVWSANPADLTSDFRWCPISYYKVVWDEGPWYLLAIEPVEGESASASLYQWRAKDDSESVMELTLSQQITANWQVALIADDWRKSEDAASLMLDWSNDQLGIGLIAPLDADSPLQIGPRAYWSNFEAYFSLTESGSSALYGVSYCHPSVGLDFAYSDEVSFFRASAPVGKFIPELRTKFTKDENFVGFGLAYLPSR